MWLRAKITNSPEVYPLVQFSHCLEAKEFTNHGPQEPMFDWAGWAAPTPSLFSCSTTGDTGGCLDVDSFS